MLLLLLSTVIQTRRGGEAGEHLRGVPAGGGGELRGVSSGNGHPKEGSQAFRANKVNNCYKQD